MNKMKLAPVLISHFAEDNSLGDSGALALANSLVINSRLVMLNLRCVFVVCMHAKRSCTYMYFYSVRVLTSILSTRSNGITERSATAFKNAMQVQLGPYV